MFYTSTSVLHCLLCSSLRNTTRSIHNHYVAFNPIATSSNPTKTPWCFRQWARQSNRDTLLPPFGEIGPFRVFGKISTRDPYPKERLRNPMFHGRRKRVFSNWARLLPGQLPKNPTRTHQSPSKRVFRIWPIHEAPEIRPQIIFALRVDSTSDPVSPGAA